MRQETTKFGKITQNKGHINYINIHRPFVDVFWDDDRTQLACNVSYTFDRGFEKQTIYSGKKRVI